jgi:hypothetical protein
MVDSKLAGARCLATKEIRTHTGLVRKLTEGTILYDLDNLGRRLIYVQWNSGVSGYVYPMEIEIVGSVGSKSAQVS